MQKHSRNGRTMRNCSWLGQSMVSNSTPRLQVEAPRNRAWRAPKESAKPVGDQLQQVRHPDLHAPAARGRFDVHETAGVIGGEHVAAGLAQRLQLPFGQAVGDLGPVEAEAAAE